MFKNYARVENEICLCQFGLYTGKSHILRTPNCQQQVHPAQCTATWRTALERCSSSETAESLGWTQNPGPEWAPKQNPEHKDICKNQEIIIPTKTSFGNCLPPLKLSCLYLAFLWLVQRWWHHSHQELTHSQAQKTQRKQRSCPSPGDKTVIPSLPPQALAHCSS